MTAKRKATTTKRTKPAAEGTDASPEYEAGFNAFMRRCAGYAVAHAGESWDTYWQAGFDDRPATPDYLEGWNCAQERMVRECSSNFGSGVSPRTFTRALKKSDPTTFAALRLRHGPQLRVVT